jgi:MFS family permease
MTETTKPSAVLRVPWYRGVPRYAWLVLLIASLGWLFDTMDQNLFNLVAQKSIRDLLAGAVSEAHLQDAVNSWRGWITSVFLLGWSVGGFVFGIMGDRLGRTRTLVVTILIYALFTGLSGVAKSVQQYMAFRFLTALGVGGEYAAGVALVAEVFPNRSRPMALGTLQALSAVGNMSAAVIVFLMSDVHWRTVFFIGALPALLVVWIRRSVREPEKWVQARAEAVPAPGARPPALSLGALLRRLAPPRVSAAGGHPARAKARLPRVRGPQEGARKELGRIGELWADPILRRNTVAGVLLAVAGVGGLWGVAFWLKDLLDIAFRPLDLTPDQRSNYGTLAFLAQQVGAFFGILAYAHLSERVGRRRSMFLFFVMAFGAVQGTFWLVNSFATAMVWAPILGFCALAPFSAYCLYFPELYPTRLRATGVGFCYNGARVLAAVAPVTLGSLAGRFAAQHGATMGFRMAASVVACIYATGLIGLIFAPETRGKPLPE